ncbi:MAG: transglutaminase domain-containing protein [Planctomycetes bacterium]|nr:transglutaminase domain-containing protein [Planctomycetota bacterium]
MKVFRFPLLALALAAGACATDLGSSNDGSMSMTAAKPGKSAKFDAKNEFKLVVPEGAQSVRIWFAAPQDDEWTTISNWALSGTVGVNQRPVVDDHGNRMIYAELAGTHPVTEIAISEAFTLERQEIVGNVDPSKARPLSASEAAKFARELGENTWIKITPEIRKIAAEVVGTETNPVIAARKLYDWTLDNIEYWVKTPATRKASATGSSEHCLTTKTGNCTDFHSLWAALARASGIPTRIVYGSIFKPALDGQDKDGSYHCWPEFYASGLGWVSHDVAVADIFRGTYELNADNEEKVRLTIATPYAGPDEKMVDYYFGNIDERRVVWSIGRDLTLDPPAAAGKVNGMFKAYVEIDGKPYGEKSADGKVQWTRKFSYREVK